jgi:hypothetical protein
MAQGPYRSKAPSLSRIHDHTVIHTTLNRTPLDEWSARRRDLYLAKHNTHYRQTSMYRRHSNPQSPPASGSGPTPLVSAASGTDTNVIKHVYFTHHIGAIKVLHTNYVNNWLQQKGTITNTRDFWKTQSVRLEMSACSCAVRLATWVVLRSSQNINLGSDPIQGIEACVFYPVDFLKNNMGCQYHCAVGMSSRTYKPTERFSRNLVGELVRWKAPLWRSSCFLEWRTYKLWDTRVNSTTPLSFVKWFMVVDVGKIRNFY